MAMLLPSCACGAMCDYPMMDMHLLSASIGSSWSSRLQCAPAMLSSSCLLHPHSSCTQELIP
jgi:hypothetical protein